MAQPPDNFKRGIYRAVLKTGVKVVVSVQGESPCFKLMAWDMTSVRAEQVMLSDILHWEWHA